MKLHSRIYGWDYVWKDFAEEVKGNIEIDAARNVILFMRAPVPNKPWLLTFYPYGHKGHSHHPGTTVVAPYQPLDDFQFAVYNEKWSSQFGKLLGMQDLQVGDEEFDTRFIVQSNNKEEVLDLFSDTDLRDLMLMQAALQLRTVADRSQLLPEWNITTGYNALVYTQQSIVDDFNHLRWIYELFVKTLTQLCAVGATLSPDCQPLPRQRLRSGFFKL